MNVVRSQTVRSTVKHPHLRKTYLADVYTRLLRKPVVLFLHHNNLTKADEAGFRQQLKNSGATLHVIQNKLFLAMLRAEGQADPASVEAAEACKDIQHPLAPLLVGPLATVTVDTVDPKAVDGVMKVLKVANERMFLVGARVEGSVMTPVDIEAFRTLPSKEEMQAQLAGVLQVLGGAGLVQTLEGASNSLYLTMKAHAEREDA